VFAKLLDAMKTGTGAPDITSQLLADVPVRANHYLVNLAQYEPMRCKGTSLLRLDNVSYNGGVYAIPQDSGVYASCTTELMKKYGLAVPPPGRR